MATQVTGQPEQAEPPLADKPETSGNNVPMPPYNFSDPAQPRQPYFPQSYPQSYRPGGYYYPGIPPRPMLLPPYPNRRQSNPVAVGLLIFFGGLLFLTILGAVFFSLFAANVLDWPGNGPLITETRTVALDNATQARVEINKGIGNLTVAGGGVQDLMSGTYNYNNSQWKPVVNYTVNGTTGNLSVRQPSGSIFGSSNYDWNLRFKNDIPLDFKFGLGVGNTVLNMAGLNVTGLVVDAGVGNTQIDLTGITPADITGTINGGVGNITLRVPQDIGVQITIKHGLGKVQVNGLMVSGDTYTNAAYGKTANTIRLNVSSGLGNIVIEQ